MAGVSRKELDDLWKIAESVEKDGAETQEDSGQIKETFTLFVGPKQGGKSSLITAFHNPTKEEGPKPTVALEYLFARRSAAPNQVLSPLASKPRRCQ